MGSPENVIQWFCREDSLIRAHWFNVSHGLHSKLIVKFVQKIIQIKNLTFNAFICY